jgi:hypothetical protein
MTPTRKSALDALALEREAAAMFADATAKATTLHLPGVRADHRLQLTRAIEGAREALAACADGDGDEPLRAAARHTLVMALSARAQDARHGAGQLSRSAQRAPTVEACHDGWQRVAEIVDTAQASAVEAAQVALSLDDRRVNDAVRAAEAAALAARQIVDERNHAYTFHADPGFSFGEAWYVAAATVLDDITVQIEPDKPQTLQAHRFFQDAGLSARLTPYRSRPRANKQLTEIVARGFRDDSAGAQRRLRAAFLGDGPITPEVAQWTDRAMVGAPSKNKVLLWVRYATHHPTRNTRHDELVELTRRALEAELVPILVGDALRDGAPPDGAIDMTLFWKKPLFQGEDMRRAQLHFFEHLRRAHAVVGQLGVTTAGMDGPALMGLPTMYLTDTSNVRMREWVGTVPGYQEIVRGQDYLGRISDNWSVWNREDPA